MKELVLILLLQRVEEQRMPLVHPHIDVDHAERQDDDRQQEQARRHFLLGKPVWLEQRPEAAEKFCSVGLHVNVSGEFVFAEVAVYITGLERSLRGKFYRALNKSPNDAGLFSLTCLRNNVFVAIRRRIVVSIVTPERHEPCERLPSSISSIPLAGSAVHSVDLHPLDSAHDTIGIVDQDLVERCAEP